MEKQIYDYFVKAKSKREINIPEKMRKEIEQSLGWGYSNVFDGALVHCADSLCTNFWIDFSKKCLVPEKEKQLNSKSLNKLTLVFSMPKFLVIPILSFFGKESIKHPRFLLEDLYCLKNWFVRSNRNNLVELVCDIFKIDNDIIFVQNMVRVLTDRGVVMSRLIVDSLDYEQGRHDKKGKWILKDGYPMEVFITFMNICGKRELNKSLKRIIEQLYAECPTRDSTIDKTKVHKFLNLLLEELIRPKDTEFRKVRLLLFFLNNHLKKVYGDSLSSDMLLRHGICNMLILYIQRCFDDPFLIGIQPTKGVYARPTIAAICDTLTVYYSADGQNSLAYKDKIFQECYNEFILSSVDLLQKVSNFYSDLISVEKEELVIEDYQEILVGEYKKYGFVSIEDQFLYLTNGAEESQINAEYPSWYGVKEDVDYFSRLNIIGQHFLNYREKIRLKHSESAGQKALKLFFASNKMETLRNGAKKLKFSDVSDGFLSLKGSKKRASSIVKSGSTKELKSSNSSDSSSTSKKLGSFKSKKNLGKGDTKSPETTSKSGSSRNADHEKDWNSILDDKNSSSSFSTFKGSHASMNFSESTDTRQDATRESEKQSSIEEVKS